MEKLVCDFDNVCEASSASIDISYVSRCNHEEGDSTRVFLHVKDMTRQEYRRIVIKRFDTDVVTLAISLFNEMGDGLDELWIDFGVGRN